MTKVAETMIDERAMIDPSAKIADGVSIGPYSVIGPHVEIGEGTKIGAHVVIQGPTKVGKHNKIFQFASVGADPQDKKYRDEPTVLEIGDNNIFREFVTINRGTVQGGNLTKIGSDNLFMAYVHIAHDCIVGSHCIFANNASLSGHVIVEDYANLGGFTAVHQFCRIGRYAFIARAMITKDILPYIMVVGETASVYGINAIGLERHGFSKETIAQLQQAYKVIFRQKLTVAEALKVLAPLSEACPDVQLFIDGLNSSERGILR